MKLHGNSHVFPECLPSGLLRCSFIYLAVLGLRHCARAPLRCGEQGPCWLPCVGFSARWPLPLQSLGSRAGPSVAAARGLSRHGPWAQPSWPVGSGAQAEQWWRTGSGAPLHVGPSRIKDQTRAPCLDWSTLTHRTAREVLPFGLPTRDTYGMPPICQVLFQAPRAALRIVPDTMGHSLGSVQSLSRVQLSATP